jgi:hypothetical protein
MVANFADENDVRILAQDAAQARGEGQADLGAHLNLADAFDLVLDGVFDRDDVLVRRVHALQRGVERGGLAGARGARHQDDAVGGSG